VLFVSIVVSKEINRRHYFRSGLRTYNVTLIRVRAIICICSLMYPVCKVHAPYCHACLVPLYNIFPHYLISGTIFEKKVTEYTMCVSIFSTLLSEKFFIQRITEGDMIKNVY